MVLFLPSFCSSPFALFFILSLLTITQNACSGIGQKFNNTVEKRCGKTENGQFCTLNCREGSYAKIPWIKFKVLTTKARVMCIKGDKFAVSGLLCAKFCLIEPKYTKLLDNKGFAQIKHKNGKNNYRMAYGETIKYVCDEGHSFSNTTLALENYNEGVITCRVNGRFKMPEGGMCIATCRPTHFGNSREGDKCERREFGKNCTFSCRAGYLVSKDYRLNAADENSLQGSVLCTDKLKYQNSDLCGKRYNLWKILIICLFVFIFIVGLGTIGYCIYMKKRAARKKRDRMFTW